MGLCSYCKKELRDGARFCPHCGKQLSAGAPPHHLPPGTVLNGKYRVGAVLGEGGFGITYEGEDVTLCLRVAIKEFYPNNYVSRSATVSTDVLPLSDPEKVAFFEKGKQRFLEEARLLARFFGARGIVDVREFFEENNTAYIVMEYLDGVTLKQHLKDRGPLTFEETVRLLSPVMESLRLLHRENLIHRDLSPDNIMLVGDEVKLLDFGAARSFDGDKSLSVFLKPGYAPYEQYQTHGKQGPWTDLYALCATVYRCITGVRIPAATDRIPEDPLQPPSALGAEMEPEAEQVLMKGLAVLAGDRWQSVEELRAAFEEAKKKAEDREKAFCKYCMRDLPDGPAQTCPFCGKDLTTKEPKHHLPPGTVLRGRYKLGAAVSDSFSNDYTIPYIALDTKQNRPVAVLEYYVRELTSRDAAATNSVSVECGREEAALYEADRARFLKNARVLADNGDLSGVVRVYDCFEENGTVYAVTEHPSGETLRERLKARRKLSFDETLRLLTPVMEALETLHRQGYLHGYLSPDAVAVSENGAKLLGFGAETALTLFLHGRDPDFFGSFPYEALEQYQSKGQVGPWTDVYALCVTVYRCVTGTRIPTVLERMNDDLPVQFFERAAELDPGVRQALLKGLALFPEDRWQSVGELLEAIEEAKKKEEARKKPFCKYCMRDLPDGSRQTCPYCGGDLTTKEPEHRLPPGTVLHGRYRLGSALGEGVLGISYIGRDETLGIPIVVKEFYPHGLADRENAVAVNVRKENKDAFEKEKRRFLDESNALAKCAGVDPGIVEIRDCFEENGTAYAVMEYLEGETLQSRLKKTGKLPWDETLRLLAPVIHALSELHKKGLQHLDVHPDNIMLLKDGGVKLLDFSSIHYARDRASRLPVPLKHGFSPLEQYQSKGRLGPWTDVYGLCATIYMCVTGQKPPDTLDRIIANSDPLQPPSALGVEIGPENEAALMRGLAVYPEDRWQTVGKLLEALTKSETIAGNLIDFGSYRQNGEEKEKIAWRILKKEGNRALVISEKALDSKRYNQEYKDVTWETCTLRQWLNNDFYNVAFTKSEKSRILSATVKAERNRTYYIYAGNETTDKVFLLSINEANQYFGSDEARKCEPTAYAVKNGASRSDDGFCWWWLRSPGYLPSYASLVFAKGNVQVFGHDVYADFDCVRPAMWIELEAEDEQNKHIDVHTEDRRKTPESPQKTQDETKPFCKYCMRDLPDGSRVICPHCGMDLTAKEPEHHLPPGTVLHGIYRLGAALDEDNFSITYVGLNTALGLKVAVKEFYPCGTVSRASASPQVVCAADGKARELFEQGKSHFLREARMLARCNRIAGIAEVRDFFEENGAAYIVTEFTEGITLRQYLRENGRLRWEETLRLFTPVLEALQKLHRESLIHCAVNPNNVMVSEKGLTLVNFSAVGFAFADSKSLAVPLYHGCSPLELYLTKGDRSRPGTDIYSLCAVIYMCVTGQTLPDATDRMVVDSDPLQPPSAFGVEIGPEKEAALMKGLAVRPEDRWQTVEELLTGFRKTAREDYQLSFKVHDGDRYRPLFPALVHKSHDGIMADGFFPGRNDNLPVIDYTDQYDVQCTVTPNCDLSYYPVVYSESPARRMDETDLSKLAPGTYRLEYPCFLSDANGFSASYSVEFRLRVPYDTVYFGSYRQNGEKKEPIAWRVLKKEGNRALVISEKALDCQPYNLKDKKVTWETCTLRWWLNNNFYNEAFNESEKGRIQTTMVKAEASGYGHSPDPGKGTKDKVFLLSGNEALLLCSNVVRRCAPTEYTVSQGASDYSWSDGKSTCGWWLRFSGRRTNRAAYVDTAGEVFGSLMNVNYSNVAVRPAMWIETET